MIIYNQFDIDRITHQMNTLSYNTRHIGCTGGLIQALMEQTQEQDISADCVVDAIKIFKHKSLEKMPRLPEIITESMAQKSRGKFSIEGCMKCAHRGIITVIRNGYESCGTCTCALGKYFNKKYEIIPITRMLDIGYVLSDIANINLEFANEYETATCERQVEMMEAKPHKDLLKRLKVMVKMKGL